MPNLSLSPSEASRFRPLPGLALLRVSPAELTSGSLHLPETAAEGEMQRQALRRGVLVKVNAQVDWSQKEVRKNCLFNEEDVRALAPGAEVWYAGHQNEMDNQFVIIKIGQIAAVR